MCVGSGYLCSGFNFGPNMKIGETAFHFDSV